MIVAKNIGRLGNNMFSISAAIGYARKYGYEYAIDYSSGYGEPYSSIHQTFPNLPKAHLGGVRYHEHPHGFCEIHKRSYDLCHFDYHPIPDIGPNVTLSGFFQSYKYFEGATEEIKKVFALPHWVEYEDYISIHVRRGDYVDHAQSFPPITENYINQALSRLKSEGINTSKVLIFSDDIPWCRSVLGVGFEYTVTGEPWNAEKMCSCAHHIIANSTWSWWWAFLGHNPKRMVISPSCERGNWFGMESGIRQDAVDLLPPSWVQIKFR